jgi:hypothetical protein
VGAAVIALLVSRFISPAITQQWDLSEAGRSREAWVTIAEFCAAAAATSILVDFALKWRKRT